MSKFIFLLYVPRSGSTFLAEKISRSTDEIGVIPEAKFVDLLLAEGEESIKNRLSVNEIFNLLTSDPRWKNLKLKEEELKHILKSKNKGIKFLVESICQYATRNQGNHLKYYLIKNGTAIWTYQNILQIFGEDSSFLHIKRDPRGAGASMINGKKAFKNRVRLIVDPISFSKYWVKYISKINEIQQANLTLVEISYEELCEDLEGTLHNIYSHFEIDFLSKTNKPNEGLTIAKQEEIIHPHIKKPPLRSRSLAWQSELNINDGLVIENITKHQINNLFFHKKVSSWYKIVILFKAKIKYIITIPINKGINIYNFLIKEKSPTLLLNKIKLLLISK